MLWFAKLVLFVYVFLVGIPISLLATTAKTPRVGGLFVGLFYLSCAWSFLVIAIKRFHDRNLPGLWAILNLIPVWVFIYVSPLSSSPEDVARLIPSIVLLFCIPYIVQIFFLPGDKGENRYGPPPESLKAWWGWRGSYGQFWESAKTYTMKMIKVLAHFLFSFRERISRNKWWVAVVVVVFFYVWQANEISDLKKRVRLHNFQMAHEPIQMAKALVYIREGGEHYHRMGCRTLLFTLADKIPIEFSEARGKYDPCPICKPATKKIDAMMDTTMAEVEKDEREFAARVERALRRLREGHPLPRY